MRRFPNIVEIWMRKTSARMHSIWFLPLTKLLRSDIVRVSIWLRSKHSLRWIRMKRKFIWPCDKRKNVKPSKKCAKRRKNCNASEWRAANVVYRHWAVAIMVAAVMWPVIVVLVRAAVFPVRRYFHNHLLALASRPLRQSRFLNSVLFHS